MLKLFIPLALATSLLPLQLSAEIKHHEGMDHSAHHGSMQGNGHGAQAEMDMRSVVEFPQAVYDQTLASMRAHLKALHRVSALSAEGKFEEAAQAAERGLGIGHQHGVDGHQSGHDYMPEGMARLGQNMHMSARELSVVLRDAEVTEDYASILGAMAKVSENCVACHDAYKLVPKR